MSLTTKLIDNLTLDKDLSVGRTEIGKGRFKYFFYILRRNSSGIMLMNFLLILFVIPAIFLIFFFLPALEKAATAAFNFSGELGMGFPGATNDYIQASIDVYNIRMIITACILPCISLLGIGMAGAFYCSRNYLWGTKVKLRIHFWRGIKKYWWQYLTSFTAMGAVACGIAISIINHFKMSLTAPAPWWSYIVMISLCIVGLLMLLFMFVFLPIQTMYGFKFKYKIKNAIVMPLILIVPLLILIVIMALPFLLALSSFTAIVMYMFLVMIGLGMYVLGISSFGQYACDICINQVLEQKEYADEKERLRRQRQANKVKNAKAKTVNNNKKGKK